MKYKIVAIILLLSVILVTASCSSDYLPQTEETTTQVAHQQITEEHSNETVKQTVEETTNIALIQQEDIGGAVLGLNKYRTRYYTLPAPFVDLVGEEECYQWRLNQPYPNDTNVMMMVNFVKDFNISREDFDKANVEFAKRIRDLLDGYPVVNPYDYANQEDDEIYNADIIYTFDNELINEYYLSHDYPYWYVDEYENAVANGEYTSQTEEWIDVEQMEAEIIAKYGEAEQVTAA